MLRDCLYFYEDLWVYDLFVGFGVIVVMDDLVNVVDYLVYVVVFFVYEFCGKCIFCWLGIIRILELLSKFNWNEVIVSDLLWLEKMFIYVMWLLVCGLG